MYDSPVEYGPALGQLRAQLQERDIDVPLSAPRTVSKENWPPDYEAVREWRAMMIATMELHPDRIPASRAYYRDHPVEFINHWGTTLDPRNASARPPKPTTFPLIMFPKQEEFVRFIVACFFGDANGLNEKSRDMGATWIAVGVSVWLWLFYEGITAGWGTNKEDQLDVLGEPKTIFEKLRIFIRNLPDFLLPQRFEPSNHLLFRRVINPENGSTISGEIGPNIGRGARTAIFFVDEAAWLEHALPVEDALMETTRCRIDMSSVSGPGTVFHTKRAAGRDWHLGDGVVRDRVNVFVMDWSDHPEKTQEIHDTRKLPAISAGNGAGFAREWDRDYFGSVPNVLIPGDWIKAAVDAEKKLKLPPPSGPKIAGLDVADGGKDANALAGRQSYRLNLLDTWDERDTGVTARRAVVTLDGYGSLQYDSIGVGSGVKAETNRLKDLDLLPRGLSVVPWNAGASVLDEYERLDPDDPESPRNRDWFANFKAQAWWALRRRFELTFRCVTEPGFYDPNTINPDHLISLDKNSLPLLDKLMMELVQPTFGASSGSMKMMVNKKPDGMKSPNLADAVVMAFYPWHGHEVQLIAASMPLVSRSR